MATNASHRIDYGEFCIWAYKGPSKKARGFWHGDDPELCSVWAFALKAPMPGTPGQFYWQTSRAKGGFADPESAIAAARAVIAARNEPDCDIGAGVAYSSDHPPIYADEHGDWIAANRGAKKAE